MPAALPPSIAALVNAAAIRFGVRPAFARAVAWVESKGNQSVVSPAGAIGVMQLMPDTARGLGVDPSNLHQNIEGGVRLLAKYLTDFSEQLTAAAYNAGPAALYMQPAKWPAETRAYVPAVINRARIEAGEPEPSFASIDDPAPSATLAIAVVVAGAVAIGLGLAWRPNT